MNQDLLINLLYPALRRNKTLKNKFMGQTCYIFGNGSSLKNIDFSHFTNRPTIAINQLVLHKDFHMLDTCAYAIPEPFFFYSYFKNPYSLKYEENIMGNLFRSEIAQYPKIKIFTSIANIFGRVKPKTYFLHHFGKRKTDILHYDICSRFSFLSGGLHSALGLAIAFGFEKAILVGCDYLMKPKTYGHFYSYPHSLNHERDDSNPYKELLQSCISKIEIEAISDKPVGCWVPCNDYETFTGSKIKYRENTEIVTNRNLLTLNKAYKMGQYTSKIFADN